MKKTVSVVLAACLLLAASVSPASARAVDLCPNLHGMQKEVPPGYIRVIGLSGWECLPIGKG